MGNGNMKTVHGRRAKGWDDFLKSIIDKIEAGGYKGNISKPEIERLILRNLIIIDLGEGIVKGFTGIDEVRKEVKDWMQGHTLREEVSQWIKG